MFERQHHLMDCRRRDFEEPYHIGFGWGGRPFTNVYA